MYIVLYMVNLLKCDCTAMKRNKLKSFLYFVYKIGFMKRICIYFSKFWWLDDIVKYHHDYQNKYKFKRTLHRKLQKSQWRHVPGLCKLLLPNCVILSYYLQQPLIWNCYFFKVNIRPKHAENKKRHNFKKSEQTKKATGKDDSSKKDQKSAPPKEK